MTPVEDLKDPAMWTPGERAIERKQQLKVKALGWLPAWWFKAK